MRTHRLINGVLTLTAVIASSGSTLAADLSVATNGPALLVRAHAHNDYEHTHPLTDALSHGFCSVEADVHLVDGQLLVAHDRSQARPERTLQSLYLDPLRERIRINGGRVYPDGPSVTLLIDVKSDAGKTYVVLREILKNYTNMLTVFRPDSVETNAITVVITGNRDRDLVAAEPVRYVSLDGRLKDLNGDESNRLIPLVSDSWTDHFKWRGVGPWSNDERLQVRALVDKAHAQGRRIRFWATPDRVEVWSELFAAGVDLLNADDLDGLQRFLLSTDLPRSKRD